MSLVTCAVPPPCIPPMLHHLRLPPLLHHLRVPPLLHHLCAAHLLHHPSQRHIGHRHSVLVCHLAQHAEQGAPQLLATKHGHHVVIHLQAGRVEVNV